MRESDLVRQAAEVQCQTCKVLYGHLEDAWHERRELEDIPVWVR